MKFIFCLQINVKGFFKLILSFQVCVARHAQSTQSNKQFAISLQYIKKEVSDEVDFLNVDKHESLLQTDTMILVGMVKHPKVPKIASLLCLYIFKKEFRDKVSYKVILLLLMGMIKYSQSTQSSKFAISLQHLKKKLGMEFDQGISENSK